MLGSSDTLYKSHQSVSGLYNTPTMPNYMVLGEGYRKSSHGWGRSQVVKGLKLPRSPRPLTTLQIFCNIKRGLRDMIRLVDEDFQLRKTSDEVSADCSTTRRRLGKQEKQLRQMERYQRRIEFHLSKIEELEENYLLHQQLLEGVKTMARAYGRRNGSHRTPMYNVDCGYKECNQVLCLIEAQLEKLLGTFTCTVQYLAGFARILPGDTYQLTMRYGRQKWKSRGHIGYNSQTWEPKQCKFNLMIGDTLNIKLAEVKRFSRRLGIGERHVETKELFKVTSQWTTMNIVSNGCLKLSVLLAWDPLDGVDEGMVISEVFRRPYLNIQRQLVSGPTLPTDEQISTSTTLDSQQTVPLSDSLSSCCATGVSMLPSSYSAPYVGRLSCYSHLTDSDYGSSSLCSSGCSTGQKDTYLRPSETRPHSITIPSTIAEDLGIARVTEDRPDKEPESLCTTEPSLTTLVEELQSRLSGYSGRHAELTQLSNALEQLKEQMDASQLSSSNQGHRSSDISVSIETVLEAFEFLDSEDCVNNSCRTSHESSLERLEASCTLSPESTTKTADSGIESLANHLSETSKLSDWSAGCDQLDVVLRWHLHHCEQLLKVISDSSSTDEQNDMLVRLQRQSVIVERLVVIATDTSQQLDIHKVLSDLTDSEELKQIWLQCVDKHLLYADVDHVMQQISQRCGNNSYLSPQQAAERIMSHILGPTKSESRRPDHPRCLTLHQFMDFFTCNDCNNLDDCIQLLSSNGLC